MAAKPKGKKTKAPDTASPMPLRIVGGKFRGHKINYHGDPVTRPMKHRVREAIFNLVGPTVEQLHAIDLFAGTGALGLEALSRGAQSATFVERHFPSAATIQSNIDHLNVAPQSKIATSDVFVWSRKRLDFPPDPWLVLCAPPYDLFVSATDKMIQLVTAWVEIAASGSQIVVESDNRFDYTRLPLLADWDVRHYAPATIALFRK
ncbi:MAG: RsmD family RNA methyltransferase [Pirellulales bacterium]|nr:RsmD family RNA methyltransferase [Pirellulales bacterium]